MKKQNKEGIILPGLRIGFGDKGVEVEFVGKNGAKTGSVLRQEPKLMRCPGKERTQRAIEGLIESVPQMMLIGVMDPPWARLAECNALLVDILRENLTVYDQRDTLVAALRKVQKALEVCRGGDPERMVKEFEEMYKGVSGILRFYCFYSDGK